MMDKETKRLSVLVGILSLVAVGVFVSAAANKPTYGTVLVDEVLRVYDGDTFFVNIYQWPPVIGRAIGIRVNGIDAPEIRDPNDVVRSMAQTAKTIVEVRLKTAKQVVLKNIKRGKYFRVVADVECDGRDLAEVLIKAGVAKRYDGGTKNVWTAKDIKPVE